VIHFINAVLLVESKINGERRESTFWRCFDSVYLEPAAELLSGGVVRFLAIRTLSGFYGI
jgi:hypothetical protein